MKQNRIFLIIALVLTICFFSGCKKNNIEACEHNFSDATCTSPSTCTKCGETRGTALGHDWLDATYESPKTCKRCGATEGDPVGEHTHVFKKATCTKPKICRICSFEEGSPLGHEESIKFPEDAKCNNTYTVEVYCTRCEELLYEDEMVKEHDLYEEIVVPVTCTTYGSSFTKCHNCDYESENILKPTGHSIVYIIDKEPTSTECGYRHRECENCDYCESKMAYVNNGFSTHGKLQVVGPDLVDQYGEKFQLIGLSTHGLQWFGRYVNYETFESLRNGFGINVIRLSLYTSEGGYCVTTPSKKAALFDLVCKGIEYATQLDMYVIVDWHMLGAEDERDENPLFYKEEAVEFFSKITEKYKDYENILFDIMNEPSGKTTWKDCKEYANLVIPAIRKNSDGIVLVGNPKWTSDLSSVMASPLEGYTNIMYSYHFYAGDGTDATLVKRAYRAGIPVFISEHGGMENTGDGPIYNDYINKWYQDLDSLNISYVAWNISNSSGSASIFKALSSDIVSVSDDNLKEWGIFYRTHVRERMGLSEYK